MHEFKRRIAQKLGRNEAFIAAAPNPGPVGKGLGKTVISWSTGDGSPATIYVSIQDALCRRRSRTY
jgi:hypothetical protein